MYGITTLSLLIATGIISHPQDKMVPINSSVNLMCMASLSSNVIFSWTHNGRPINGSSTTGDTSILTFTSVRESDAGSYVCTVRSGSLSVMSNVATLTVYGKIVYVRVCQSVTNYDVLSLFRSTSDHRITQLVMMYL